MSKPDPKTRTVNHIDGNKKNAKSMAQAKGRETVDVKWESTPTWTIHTMNMNKTEPKNDYKLFTEEGNKGNDDYDTE